jgi:hypothetical protein
MPNDRADLSILKPLVQVPIEASAAPSNKAKAGKLMVASSTTL